MASMKLVRFDDGTYGVMESRWYGNVFLSMTNNGYWWHASKVYAVSTHCTGTKEEALFKLNNPKPKKLSISYTIVEEEHE
jgi:hypothetical protein